MQEALKNYLAMATGLTEVSKKRAKAAAKKLAKSGGATVEQVQNLTEELLSTSLANREAMVRLVRYEIDRALGKIGLATADEVEQLNARVRQLEQQVRDAERPATATEPAMPSVAPTKRTAPPRTVAKKAPAKSAPAKTAASRTGTGVANAGAAPRKAVPPAKAARKATPAKTTPAKTTTRKAMTRTTSTRANGSGPGVGGGT